MLAPRSSALATVPALLALALGACGGDDGAPPPRGAAGYCEAIAPFFCEFYARCGRMDVPSAAACAAPFLTSCNQVFEPRYVDLEAAGLLALDPAGIERCRAHLATVPCAQQPLELAGPCAGMWVGQVPAGARCGLDVESFVCAPGAACVLGLDLCGDCRPLVAVGQACTPGTDTCGNDAFCDAGTCRARVANGQPCGPSDRCMTGAACEAGVCTGPTFVGRGEACDARRRCPYLAACLGGTCRPTASAGEACAADGECEVGSCDAGACAPPRATGAPCARAAQCATGLCDAGACQARPSACIAP